MSLRFDDQRVYTLKIPEADYLVKLRGTELPAAFSMKRRWRKICYWAPFSTLR
jgi:hypothetical protein